MQAIDRKAAEVVLGWRFDDRAGFPRFSDDNGLAFAGQFTPTTDIGLAFHLVDAMKAKGWFYRMNHMHTGECCTFWQPEGEWPVASRVRPTLADAITQAAIEALTRPTPGNGKSWIDPD